MENAIEHPHFVSIRHKNRLVELFCDQIHSRVTKGSQGLYKIMNVYGT